MVGGGVLSVVVEFQHLLFEGKKNLIVWYKMPLPCFTIILPDCHCLFVVNNVLYGWSVVDNLLFMCPLSSVYYLNYF